MKLVQPGKFSQPSIPSPKSLQEVGERIKADLDIMISRQFSWDTWESYENSLKNIINGHLYSFSLNPSDYSYSIKLKEMYHVHIDPLDQKTNELFEKMFSEIVRIKI